MPKKGFKSITINAQVYDKLHQAFLRDKSNQIPFFSYWLTNHIQAKLDESEKLRKLAKKIKIVPESFEGYVL